MQCHIAVYLDDGDPLHFRAGRAAAEAFAAAAIAQHLARVIIDEHISPAMPVMPYEELWR